MKLFILLIAIFLSGQLFGQDSPSVVIHKDPRVDMLLRKQIEFNELNSRESRRFVSGYRILVLNTNDRNKAIDAKARIVREFPEMKSYLTYQPPFFKVKLGDFKDRSEAEEVLPDVQRFFPSGVFIVRDIIEVNPDRSADLQ